MHWSCASACSGESTSWIWTPNTQWGAREDPRWCPTTGDTHLVQSQNMPAGMHTPHPVPAHASQWAANWCLKGRHYKCTMTITKLYFTNMHFCIYYNVNLSHLNTLWSFRFPCLLLLGHTAQNPRHSQSWQWCNSTFAMGPVGNFNVNIWCNSQALHFFDSVQQFVATCMGIQCHCCASVFLLFFGCRKTSGVVWWGVVSPSCSVCFGYCVPPTWPVWALGLTLTAHRWPFATYSRFWWDHPGPLPNPNVHMQYYLWYKKYAQRWV